MVVLFPSQPDLRSGAEKPRGPLRFLDVMVEMYVLIGSFPLQLGFVIGCRDALRSRQVFS